MKEVALVLGKFLDFHQGHEALIRFAQSKAEKVLVLLCCTKEDRRDPFDRYNWIHDTFGNSIEIVEFWYQEEAGLDGGEESDRGISEAWANWVDDKHPEVDLIVGSEDYVRYMADYGDFDFELFDIDRQEYPCSSTSVNAGAFGFRTVAAKADLVKRVGFIGPESSGKTTSACRAGSHFDYDVVYESARKLMKPDGTFTYQDLDMFALQQQFDILETVHGAEAPVVLIDSTAITTASYSWVTFNAVSPIVKSAMENEAIDLYLVFSPEVDFIQDGTRHMDGQLEREKFFQGTLNVMETYGLPHVVITGTDHEDRLKQVITAIEEL